MHVHTCTFVHVQSSIIADGVIWGVQGTHMQYMYDTGYCIWRVISPISNLKQLSSSLRLLGHVPLKRGQLDWNCRFWLNDTQMQYIYNTCSYVYLHIYTFNTITGGVAWGVRSLGILDGDAESNYLQTARSHRQLWVCTCVLVCLVCVYLCLCMCMCSRCMCMNMSMYVRVRVRVVGDTESNHFQTARSQQQVWVAGVGICTRVFMFLASVRVDGCVEKHPIQTAQAHSEVVIWVCVCVCVRVRVCIHTYIWIYAYTHVHTQSMVRWVCMWVCVYTCIHIQICKHTCAHAHTIETISAYEIVLFAHCGL